MSDFDKEAERQRLREKYERDQKKREATQRMSELLLQGATMTNKHCDACGDPIFRYDGQEFCPTCQAAEAEGSDAAADATEGAAPDDAATGSAATDATGDVAADASTPEAGASQSDGASSEAGTEADVTTDAEAGADAASSTDAAPATGDAGEQPSAAAREHPDVGGAPGVNGRVDSDSASAGAARSDAPSATASARATAARAGSGADVSDARASLVRTLTRLSREAEAAEDPRRAREYLAAAREAAEAVAALDR